MELTDVKHELQKDGEIITKRLEKWAEEIGDRTFFFYGEDNLKITYREFNRLTNSIGHHLKNAGIEKGDRISLFLKNPMITALSMFGIWKVGAIYCPINFNYKGRLLSYQIKDTNPKLFITERELVPFLNEIKEDIPSLNVVVHDPKKGDHDYNPNAQNIVLDQYHKEFRFADFLKGETSNLGTNLKYMDTANIIYTSGTTGLPKGVVHSYRWINNYIFNLRKLVHQEDVIYNDLPLYHVAAAFSLVSGAAWVGCQVAVWDKFSSKDFWPRIKISGATWAILLDVMIPWLMNAKETPEDHKNTLNKVYMAPLPQYHHQVAKRFGLDFVLSGFGQTETGNGAICIIKELEEGTPPDLYRGYSREEISKIAQKYNLTMVDGQKELPRGFMGQPSALFEANILDGDDEECAPGEVGELVFRPRFPHLLFTEYFGKPEATLKAFRNLWFHTGDACYKDEKGNYYFVDRMGGVIRVKGEFVSSYQIEDIINGHSKVDVCAAFPIPAEVGDESDIVVYIVPKPGGELREDEIRQWIDTQMPKFMRPKYIQFIDDLPKTPTSKIEKYKLREKIRKELGKV
jgi:crotonobetaine/carnitine-CoA ligase